MTRHFGNASTASAAAAEQPVRVVEPHPVDGFTITPPLYSGDDREFGRIGNPDGTIVLDTAGSFAPQRVSWSEGQEASEVYVASFIPARRWNGWAKPYFSQSECLRLARSRSAFNDSMKFEYDAERDVWQEFNDEEGYREDCPWMVIGDRVCHQVGSGLTWIEIQDEQPRPDRAGRKPAGLRASAFVGRGVGLPDDGSFIYQPIFRGEA